MQIVELKRLGFTLMVVIIIEIALVVVIVGVQHMVKVIRYQVFGTHLSLSVIIAIIENTLLYITLINLKRRSNLTTKKKMTLSESINEGFCQFGIRLLKETKDNFAVEPRLYIQGEQTMLDKCMKGFVGENNWMLAKLKFYETTDKSSSDIRHGD